MNNTRIIYVVREGDTLSSIAKNMYGNADEWHWLAVVNKLADPDLIHPGQRIWLPDVPGHRCSVQVVEWDGDALDAARYRALHWVAADADRLREVMKECSAHDMGEYTPENLNALADAARFLQKKQGD